MPLLPGDSLSPSDGIPNCRARQRKALRKRVCAIPDLHCIVSGGGLSQGKRISSKRRFLFPVKVMSRLFRGKFLAVLKKAYEKKSLQCVGEDLPSLLKG